MKRVTLTDSPTGHAVGWNPDGSTIGFVIIEPGADFDSSYISASVTSNRLAGGGLLNAPCTAAPIVAGNAFRISCGNTSPSDGSELHYLIINLPEHVS